MKILYADNDVTTRDYVSMIVEMGLECEILEVSSGNEALTVLGMEDDIDLIISEVEMPGGNGDMIADYVKEHSLNIPFIWLTTQAERHRTVEKVLLESTRNGYVQKPFKDADFFPVVERALSGEDQKGLKVRDEVSADWSLKKGLYKNQEVEADWDVAPDATKKKQTKVPAKKESFEISTVPQKVAAEIEIESKEIGWHGGDGKYCRIKTTRFLNFNTTCCDVFIKLSEKKYVKLINGKDLYDSSLVDRYINKQVKYLFILKEMYGKFSMEFGQLVSTRLASNNLTVDDRIQEELASLNSLQDQVGDYGMNEESIEQAKATVNSSLRVVKTEPDLFDLIKNVMQGKNYISEHSLLLSYICTHISKKTNWGTESTLQKLSMACLFHDVAFDDPNLAQLHDSDLQGKSVSTTQQKIIDQHCQKASEILQKTKSLYPDIDTIVLQHHEKPDGTGYPRGLAANSISPMACIFIIAEDFVHKIFGKKRSEVDTDAIIKEFEGKYKSGNFKKPLEGFKNAFSKGLTL